MGREKSETGKRFEDESIESFEVLCILTVSETLRGEKDKLYVKIFVTAEKQLKIIEYDLQAFSNTFSDCTEKCCSLGKMDWCALESLY